MALFPPPIQTLLISYFNPNNFINASAFDYTKTDTRYLKKNGDTSYGTIIAPNFTGQASNSTNVNLTDEILQNSACLIPFSVNTNGNQPLKTNSNLNYNPNTGILNVGYISTTGSITSTSGMTAGGLLSANSGLTIGGANNITLGSGATAPTQGIQLGGTYTPILTWVTTAGSLGSQSVSAGVYIATFSINLNGTFATNNYIFPTGAGVTDYRFLINSNTQFGQVGVVSGTYYFKTASTTSVGLSVVSNNSFTTIANSNWTITRIA